MKFSKWLFMICSILSIIEFGLASSHTKMQKPPFIPVGPSMTSCNRYAKESMEKTNESLHTTDILQYSKHADFSDIFKGYNNSCVKKIMPDYLLSLTKLEKQKVKQKLKSLPVEYDKIRKVKINCTYAPSDRDLLAKAILEKISVLFQSGANGELFTFYNASGIREEISQLTASASSSSSAAVSQNSEKQLHTWTQDHSNLKIAYHPLSTETLNEEQQCFILCIRHAILKIAQNPVGRRLFLRILKSIGNHRIVILQVQCGFGLMDKPLMEKYWVITVPWKTSATVPVSSKQPVSSALKPGQVAILTPIWKQLSIKKSEAYSNGAKIIGSKGELSDDVKPFYISFCHELIHVLHKLENKFVDLDAQKVNERIYECQAPDCCTKWKLAIW